MIIIMCGDNMDIYAYGRPYVRKESAVAKRKMTVVFQDEDLYTQLKIEAIKRRTPASNIVAEAVREWMESRYDASLLPEIKSRRQEWQEKGGRSWEDVESDLEINVNKRQPTSEEKRV